MVLLRIMLEGNVFRKNLFIYFLPKVSNLPSFFRSTTEEKKKEACLEESNFGRGASVERKKIPKNLLIFILQKFD